MIRCPSPRVVRALVNKRIVSVACGSLFVAVLDAVSSGGCVGAVACIRAALTAMAFAEQDGTVLTFGRGSENQLGRGVPTEVCVPACWCVHHTKLTARVVHECACRLAPLEQSPRSQNP